MKKEDYMRLPKDRLAELLVERDELEEIIEDKIVKKLAELLNEPSVKILPSSINPWQTISVLYGCPADFTYTTDSNKNPIEQ